MPLHAIIFFVCQAVVSSYALVRGGLPERIVAVELAFTALTGQGLDIALGHSFYGMEWRALAIDGALLTAVVPVALYANRYWPLWIAAVQLDTIAVHGVRAFDPSLRASVYYIMAGYAAYPILILLALGTLRHRDRSARAGAREPAWIL